MRPVDNVHVPTQEKLQQDHLRIARMQVLFFIYYSFPAQDLMLLASMPKVLAAIVRMATAEIIMTKPMMP